MRHHFLILTIASLALTAFALTGCERNDENTPAAGGSPGASGPEVRTGGTTTPGTTGGGGATTGVQPGGTGQGLSPEHRSADNASDTPSTQPATQPSAQSDGPLPAFGNTPSGAKGISYPHPSWNNATARGNGQTGGSGQIGSNGGQSQNGAPGGQSSGTGSGPDTTGGAQGGGGTGSGTGSTGASH